MGQIPDNAATWDERTPSLSRNIAFRNGVAIDMIASIDGDRVLGWDLGADLHPQSNQAVSREYVEQWNLLTQVDPMVDQTMHPILVRMAPEIFANPGTVGIISRTPLQSVIFGITWPRVAFDIRRFQQIVEFAMLGGARLAAVDEGSGADIMHHPVNDLAGMIVAGRRVSSTPAGWDRVRSLGSYGSMVGLDVYLPDRVDGEAKVMAAEMGVNWVASIASELS